MALAAEHHLAGAKPGSSVRRVCGAGGESVAEHGGLQEPEALPALRGPLGGARGEPEAGAEGNLRHSGGLLASALCAQPQHGRYCPEHPPALNAIRAWAACLPDPLRALPQDTIAELEAAAEAADSAAAPAVMDFTWLTQVPPPAPCNCTAEPLPF